MLLLVIDLEVCLKKKYIQFVFFSLKVIYYLYNYRDYCYLLFLVTPVTFTLKKCLNIALKKITYVIIF